MSIFQAEKLLPKMRLIHIQNLRQFYPSFVLEIKFEVAKMNFYYNFGKKYASWRAISFQKKAMLYFLKYSPFDVPSLQS